MKKIIFVLFWVVIVCPVFSINKKPVTTRTKKSNKIKKDQSFDYCSMIETLVLARYKWETVNFYDNNIIPILVQKSKINSNSKKGYIGFTYPNDSTFDEDIKKMERIFSL
jgi:beta-glucosidase/6-phospho-beta-glucosidase/beta-galactosidase